MCLRQIPKAFGTGKTGSTLPAPGLLVTRYPLSSALLLARRQMALASFRAILVGTCLRATHRQACPALGPRWRPGHLARARPELLPSALGTASAFPLQRKRRGYPMDHDLKDLGAQSRPDSHRDTLATPGFAQSASLMHARSLLTERSRRLSGSDGT